MTRPVRYYLSPTSLSLIGVPHAMETATIESFDTGDSPMLQKVKDFVTSYLNDLSMRSKGIFFYGSNGVGKTMLSSIIIREAYRRRYTCRRAMFVDYVAAYTKSWKATSREEADQFEDDFFDRFKGVEILVLDELGKEIDSKATAPILEDCLRYREDKSLITIICTNLNPDAIEQRYGISCFSLITGNMTPVKIEGLDQRRKKK